MNFRGSRNNVGAMCSTIYGTRVVVVGHQLGRDCAQHDLYDLVDLDTGAESQRMGSTWLDAVLPVAPPTRYGIEVWSGCLWTKWGERDGIGAAFEYARHLVTGIRYPWPAARVVCGSVVIDEVRVAQERAA